MRFVLSYITAFFKIAAVLGLAFLGIVVVERRDMLADYFVWVSIIAAFAGPISEAVKK